MYRLYLLLAPALLQRQELLRLVRRPRRRPERLALLRPALHRLAPLRLARRP